MEHITIDVASAQFWIGIVVAIVLHIVARRVDDWLQKRQSTALRGIAKRWQLCNTKARAKFEARVRTLVGSPHLLALSIENEMRLRLASLALLILVLLFFTLREAVKAKGGWASPTLSIMLIASMALNLICFQLASRLDARNSAARLALASAPRDG